MDSLSGVYLLSYQICEMANTYNCSTTNVKITVRRTVDDVILAGADSGTSVEGMTGTIDILTNDTLS